jgi:DNA adenine methylase
MKKNKLMAPFVKWVGGKRQLIPEIQKYFPERITGKYYEPFVGGGAVLFCLQPSRAVINDLNTELINLYKVVRDNVDELIEDLKKHKNEEDYYYRLRELDRTTEFDKLSSVEKASRIHYLNKTCYNGLYRVNNLGEFNSPFGKYANPNIVNEINFKAVSAFLVNKGVEITNVDYAESVKFAKRGDFVYFDPPYEPLSDSSNFTGYTKGGFSKEEQQRLKLTCDDLHKKEVNFLLSNSNTSFIRKLFEGYIIKIVRAKRRINSIADKRGEVEEVLIMNYSDFKMKA